MLFYQEVKQFTVAGDGKDKMCGFSLSHPAHSLQKTNTLSHLVCVQLCSAEDLSLLFPMGDGSTAKGSTSGQLAKIFFCHVVS